MRWMKEKGWIYLLIFSALVIVGTIWWLVVHNLPLHNEVLTAWLAKPLSQATLGDVSIIALMAAILFGLFSKK